MTGPAGPGRIASAAGAAALAVALLGGVAPAAAVTVPASPVDTEGAVIPISLDGAIIPIPLDGATEPLQVEKTEGDEVTIEINTDVLFDFDSAKLAARAREHLRDLASELTDVQGPIRVDGHTDSIGSTSYNKRLSERRAEAVKRELRDALGGDVTIEAEGHGEADPVEPHTVGGDDNPAGRAKNRRVTFTYSNS